MGSFRRLWSGTEDVAVFSGCCFSSEDEMGQSLLRIAPIQHILGFIKITQNKWVFYAHNTMYLQINNGSECRINFCLNLQQVFLPFLRLSASTPLASYYH